MRYLSGSAFFWLLAALFLFGSSSALAQDDRVYVGLDGGVSMSAGDFKTSNKFVNHPTRCDSLLYPAGQTAPKDAECTSLALSEIANSFSPGIGFAGGATIGYAFSTGLRIEAEYLNRRQGSEKNLVRIGSSATDSLDQKATEWEPTNLPSERVYDMNAHHFFLNVFYDLYNDSAIVPYIGGGVGMGLTRMKYEAKFYRKKDLGPAAWQMKAADTLSSQDVNLDNTGFGFQAVGGVDYAFSEAFSVGVKARWTRFSGFDKKNVVWDQIRSHKAVRADGVTPFTSDFKIDPVSVWTFTAGVKYYLPI